MYILKRSLDIRIHKNTKEVTKGYTRNDHVDLNLD